jgi:hypothetical protein
MVKKAEIIPSRNHKFLIPDLDNASVGRVVIEDLHFASR